MKKSSLSEDFVLRTTPLFGRTTLFCRDDWIRTSGLLHPMQTRYRAALRPELKANGYLLSIGLYLFF